MSLKLKENLTLLRAAVRKPKEVSTFFPTSKALASEVLNHHNLRDGGLVVELGPGTGAITRPLLTRMGEDTEYIGLELMPDLVDSLKEEFPDTNILCAPAQDLTAILEGRKADVIISSLPWTMMSVENQNDILKAIIENLKPGGSFATYVCVNAAWYPAALRLKEILGSAFQSVTKSPVVWANIPPAFVYFCRK